MVHAQRVRLRQHFLKFSFLLDQTKFDAVFHDFPQNT